MQQELHGQRRPDESALGRSSDVRAAAIGSELHRGLLDEDWPVNSFTGDPSFIPEVKVTNTGTSTLTLPDMAQSNSAIQFDVRFLNSSGGLVNEDQGMQPDQGSATVVPGQSFTFTPTENNGVVNDDQSQDTVHVTSCTATMTGGY
jgi:hypothetical protein